MLGAVSAVAEYWTSPKELENEGKIQCRLCPHACILEPGQAGICQIRLNRAGTMTLPFYAQISSIALDPVEKKPLRQFLPGTKTFSVGFWHCNMHCPFCQNWEIAHPTPSAPEHYSQEIAPKALIEMAVRSGCPSISFTYSEPTIHIEYVKESMKIAHEKGLATILVTNGNLLAGPAHDLLSLTDATNVDLKCFSATTYHSVLGGELKTVQNFIRTAAELSHVEVTSLLVPGVLDDKAQMEGIADFLSAISRAIPLHITAYRPEFHWSEPPLSSSKMREIARPAFEKLDYVYLSQPLPMDF